MNKSSITYQEKINELRLDISHPNSRGINFVFVEGDTDIRVYRKLFDLEKCKVENIPGGNPKLEECVRTLTANYPLIIGIRDADFLRLNDIPYNERNMFLTDCHDIEKTMLCHEPLINALFFEYSNHLKENHIEIINNIKTSILKLSLLKWLNHLENLELDFSPGFHDLISFDDFSIDITQYINRVLAKSPNAVIKSADEILIKLDNLSLLNPDLLQLTNGHDLLNAMAKYFREKQGRSGISGKDLQSSIRMLFDEKAFQSTNLYNSLIEWQKANATSLF